MEFHSGLSFCQEDISGKDIKSHFHPFSAFLDLEEGVKIIGLVPRRNHHPGLFRGRPRHSHGGLPALDGRMGSGEREKGKRPCLGHIWAPASEVFEKLDAFGRC